MKGGKQSRAELSEKVRSFLVGQGFAPTAAQVELFVDGILRPDSERKPDGGTCDNCGDEAMVLMPCPCELEACRLTGGVCRSCWNAIRWNSAGGDLTNGD